MKKILTVGVFDLLHIGHLILFRKAKEYGDFLTVAVHNDIQQIKATEFIYSLEERIDFVSALKIVDEVIIYERIDLLVPTVDFDIFIFGEDQNHEYFQKAFKWCMEHNKELIMLERTKGISSSLIRKVLEKKEV